MSTEDTEKDKPGKKDNSENTSESTPIETKKEEITSLCKKDSELNKKEDEPQTPPEDPINNDYETSSDISEKASVENSDSSPEEIVKESSDQKHVSEENKTENTTDNQAGEYPVPATDIKNEIDEQEKIHEELETTTETFSGSQAKDEIKNLLQQKDSNYQISLINENLLKIVVTTDRGVNIDCSVKERKNSKETQSNKIYLHPKPDNIKQEIEIIISIDSTTGEVTVQKKNDSSEEVKPGVLTPNPELAHLIPYEEELTLEKTPDQLLEERLGKKNPYNLFRMFYQRNLTIGIVGAIILQSFMILLFYAFIGKFDHRTDENDNKRLIVISDMPDPKINIKEFEDPNKPKEGPKVDPETKITKLPGDNPFSINRTIKPPRIKRPQINRDIVKRDTVKTDSTKDLTSTLDSLRKVNNGKKDSLTKLVDTTGFANKNPVDTTGQFKNGDVGLYIPYKQLAPYLKLVDSREINKNVQDFEGVLLTDTTKSQGSMTMFITLDKTGETFERSFKDKGKPFPMIDSTLTAYYLEPYTQIKRTKFSFYVLGKVNKVNITLETKAELFNDYKSVVEQLVKNIRIN